MSSKIPSQSYVYTYTGANRLRIFKPGTQVGTLRLRVHVKHYHKTRKSKAGKVALFSFVIHLYRATFIKNSSGISRKFRTVLNHIELSFN